MKAIYCIHHQRVHESMGWSHKKWDGENDAWGCNDSVKYPEFVPDGLKQDRKEHAKDMIQPRRGGEPNPEFIKHYPQHAEKHYNSQELAQVKKTSVVL
ncbi:MAG TPA: hypothetical protein ENI23_13975 [bacterium]|nr:hypothetical protein [bacterium]